jgi:hypothetical protein
MPNYPTSIPSPYITHVHPYPTRFHGGIWKRPVFGLPWVRQPLNVLRPSQMMGIGEWDVGTGVFRRPDVDGGGLFNEISGLGDVTTTGAKFLGAAALAFGVVYFLARKK